MRPLLLPNNKPRRFRVAAVGAPVGLMGEVRLTVFVEDVSLLSSGALFLDDGTALSLAGLRGHGGKFVARFVGVDSRTAAEGLKGAGVFLDRGVLPETEDDTYYHGDLVGLRVGDQDAREVGVVSGVFDFDAGDVLEITPVSGEALMLPFAHAFFPKIDLEAGIILAVLPEETQ